MPIGPGGVEAYAGAERQGYVAGAVTDRGVDHHRDLPAAEAVGHDGWYRAGGRGAQVADQHPAYAVEVAGPERLGEQPVDPVRGFGDILQSQDDVVDRRRLHPTSLASRVRLPPRSRPSAVPGTRVVPSARTESAAGDSVSSRRNAAALGPSRSWLRAVTPGP